MSKRFCLILSLAIGMALLAVLPALAESVDTAWVRRYNGPADSSDNARAIAVDDSGYVYVTGWSYDTGTDEDYSTIKYYPDGDSAWVRRHNGSGNGSDRACALAVDDSGNVYVTGASCGDYATVKYKCNGDTAWVRTYNGPGNGDDGACDIAVDDSGYVYVTGGSVGDGTQHDYATIKYCPSGDTAWVRRYIGPANGQNVASALAVDDSGNIYVTGVSDSSGIDWDWDYLTIKYDRTGKQLWVSRYSGLGNSNELAPAIAVDSFRNPYVCGVRDSGSVSYVSYYVTIKYDPQSGDTLWVRQYLGQFGMEARGNIAIDAGGNVCITGGSLHGGTTEDYGTVKYHPNGDTAWLRLYDGPGESVDMSWALTVDLERNIYVTGGSWGSDKRDYATVKYSPTGDRCWVIRYNGLGNSYDDAFAIAVNDSGNVYVTGSSYGSGTDYDYATIKYVQDTTTYVKDETSDREKPSEFTLFQNYPNPFNQSTKIGFTLAKSGFVSLSIYDILGRKVRTLVSERLSSGHKSVLWDGRNDSGKDVASGIYFYQIKVENPASGGVGDFSETKKLVLLK